MASTRNTHSRVKHGFTLIELLVVIAIIGVLSAIVLAGVHTAQQYGRDAQRQADLGEMQRALELYASDHNGSYPAGSYLSQCAAWGSLPANSVIPGLVSGGYIGAIPSDPSMVAASNQNCFIYISDTVNYKILDYNMVDSANPGAEPTLVDPLRNYGRSWATTGCTSNGDPAVTWAVWSSNTAKCAW